MHTEFEIYLKTQAGLSEEVIRRISDLAISKTLRRNEYLFNAGEICRNKIFVVKGLIRMFNTTSDGNEHILQFSPENTWTLDVESYDKQIPSLVSINAIESSTVLLWQKDDFNTLLQDIPELKKLSERLISQNIYYNRHRMITTLGATPEDRYNDFLKTFPHLQSRLPLRMVASYLGISLKTLNRIRHSQIQTENSVK